MRKQFEMSKEQYEAILSACAPVAAIMLQCGMPRSQQENANDAWKRLGKEMGFVWDTVQPAGTGPRFFSAEVVESLEPPAPVDPHADHVRIRLTRDSLGRSKAGDLGWFEGLMPSGFAALRMDNGMQLGLSRREDFEEVAMDAETVESQRAFPEYVATGKPLRRPLEELPTTPDQNGTAAAMLAVPVVNPEQIVVPATITVPEVEEAPMPTTEAQTQAIARGEMEARAVRAEAEVEQLRAGIRGAIETILTLIGGEPPDPNCSCHLNPPCSDCVDHHYNREALADLRALLNAPTEAKS